MTLYFTINGKTMTAEQLKAVSKPAKKAAPRESLKAVTSRKEAKISMGFVVTGYPPLEIAQARARHEAEAVKAVGSGEPAMEPFDLNAYARKNKPTKVRAKPFTIEAAADDAAALVKRMGWHLVETNELLRG